MEHKNIAVFSDGTCNESDKGYPTNVRKLYQAIERRTSRQVAFYDAGVGTNFWKVAGSAFGVGISKNIQECYEFIVDSYEPGDSIFLFGFSRGAYTVRSLAGMIKWSGLLKRQHREHLEMAFTKYKKSIKDPDAARRFKARYANDVPVYCIGVWDTVSALGFPFSAVRSLNPLSTRLYGFHDARLCDTVSHGYQALAVDDNRKVFTPKIWDESQKPAQQVIEQVWFPGVHSNVGGGYRRTELSDISLRWMIHKAQGAGLIFWNNYQTRVLMAPSPHGKMYNPRAGIGKVYLKTLRNLSPGNNLTGKPRIHESVFLRKDRADNNYCPENIPDEFIPCNQHGDMTKEALKKRLDES